MNRNSIKLWAEEDRPREKLILKGSRQLTNAELLAILIGSGTSKLSALDITKQILNEYNDSLVSLSKASVQDLVRFKGIGEAKAISIISSMELTRRRSQEEPEKRRTIKSSADAFKVLSPIMSDLYHEEFYVLLLNRANQLLRISPISSGGFSGTVADGKVIFREALQYSASGIILAHNHPSGQLVPSNADKKLTRSLKEFGNFVELTILDHLIVGDNDYFSFADQGIL